MNKTLFFLTSGIFFLLACSNTPAGSETSQSISAVSSAPHKSGGDCGNMLLFKKGTVVTMSNYNMQGNMTSKSVSKVINVTTEGGLTIDETELTNTDEKGNNPKVTKTTYKCDGKFFYVDMTSLLAQNKMRSEQKTNGIQFPFNPAVGEVLADGEYTVTMKRGGKQMSITSHSRERKVEAKEAVTTTAGKFDCYKVSSIIETDVNMPEMDKRTKQIMEEVKKKTGKNKMIFWYAPGSTIIKMEFYTGDKLTLRSEVTDIKK